MILRRLELKNFGRFGQMTVEFRRGINLVSGPNESGKSTLMEAVPAILFGCRNKERYRPWGKQVESEGGLVFEERDRVVRVTRDLQSDRVTLVEKDGLHQNLYTFEGKAAPYCRYSERSEYLEQLVRLLGVSDEEMLRASLFFGQGSLELPGKGGLPAKIKTLLSGFVEVDYDQVLASLNEDYFAITKVNPWGKDKSKDRELDSIVARIGELEKRWYAARDASEKLDALRTRMAHLEEELEVDRGEHEKGERYLGWVRRQWQLEEREQLLRKDFNRIDRESGKVGELDKERNELLESLKKTGLPQEIPEDLTILLSEAEKIRRELVQLQAEGVRVREKLLALGDLPWKKTLLQSLAVWGAAALVGGLWSSTLIWALSLAGVATFALWIYFMLQASRTNAERGRLKGQGQQIELRREELQAQLEGLDDRFQALGMSPTAVELVRMQKNLDHHKKISLRLREVESALKVLEEEGALQHERSGLVQELAVLEERMEKEKPLRGDALISREELPEAEAKLKQLGESITAREKELLELTREEASLAGELFELRQIEEEGELLQERRERLAKRKNALATAYNLLSESVEEFRLTYMERFASDVGRFLAQMSGGRYSAVKLMDDFSIELCDAAGDWHASDFFSRGTVDALYFSVRLALSRHLCRGRRLPILLDDPLVNLDRGRCSDALQLIEKISADHQIILFAHDEELLRRGTRDRWQVLTLGESAASGQARHTERSEDIEQLRLL